jgi:glycolate oxidase FAD binding subunit
MNAKPNSIQEVQELTRQAVCLLPRGGGTKPALSYPKEGIEILDMSGVAGILEYEPGEFTFTALAGTPVAEVERILAGHGQFLPFDPLLMERGATLGGTVAANASGSGRYHYGGIRDFLMGVRFVDSQGQVVHGGGKVVKNAAGFDLPKLMVGSLGGLGVFVELAFKVFPRPEVYATLRIECDHLEQALQVMQQARSARLELDALDLQPYQAGYVIWVRLGGLASALPARLERLKDSVGECRVVQGADEAQLWQEVRAAAWMPDGWALVKVPLTPGRIPSLEASLAGKPVLRRYVSGGQLAWLALEDSPQTLDGLLSAQGLSGLVLLGPPGQPRLGVSDRGSFYRRIKTALDPIGRFAEV